MLPERDAEQQPRESGIRLIAALPGERIRALVEDHFDFVSRTLLNLGLPSSDVDDAVQQVLVIAARKIELIERGREAAFLYSTARRVAANAHRRLASRRKHERLDETALLAAPDGHDPEQAFVDREARERLEQVLGAMPADLREVFVLFELEGLTQATIAEVLAIPSGTVASRLRRARTELELCAQRLR